MKDYNTNPPAFPVTWSEQEGETLHCHRALGLSRREYFAVKAMQALLIKDEGGSLQALALKAARMADIQIGVLEKQG